VHQQQQFLLAHALRSVFSAQLPASVTNVNDVRLAPAGQPQRQLQRHKQSAFGSDLSFNGPASATALHAAVETDSSSLATTALHATKSAASSFQRRRYASRVSVLATALLLQLLQRCRTVESVQMRQPSVFSEQRLQQFCVLMSTTALRLSLTAASQVSATALLVNLQQQLLFDSSISMSSASAQRQLQISSSFCFSFSSSDHISATRVRYFSVSTARIRCSNANFSANFSGELAPMLQYPATA
jgi:hypothetical protein